MPLVTTRAITPGDAATIAALHAASWLGAYRGILSDAYLDGPVHADPRALWAERLAAHTPATSYGYVAEAEGTAVGFAWAYPEADPRLGTLLDNLHVVPGARSGGIGRVLLGAVAREVVRRDGMRGLFLHVFDANVRARAFYERHGARPMYREARTAADGTPLAAWVYAWDAATALAD